MPNPILFLILLFVVLAGPAILVVWGSISKNHWGINLHAVSCPRCSTALPLHSKPHSLQQVLWGGHTCPTCGTEVDKWGREVPPGNRKNTFLGSLTFSTPVALLFGLSLVALNLWYDYYHHIGYFFDAIIIAVLIHLRLKREP